MAFDARRPFALARAVSIPVIASGGAGTPEHFPPAIDAGWLEFEDFDQLRATNPNTNELR